MARTSKKVTQQDYDEIYKNYIINGGCEYFQAGGASTPIAVPGAFDYPSMDMFEMEVSGTWTSPESVRSNTTVGSRSRRSHLFQGTPTALSDEFRMKTKIESIYAFELINSNISLALNLISNNFTQVQITVSYADVEDDFSAVTQIAQQTIDFNADSSEQEVLFENIAKNANVKNGIQIQYDFKGLGSLDPTTLYVGEFVLNKGRDAREYNSAGRDQIEEFDLCRRYFEKDIFEVSGYSNSSTLSQRIPLTMKVSKRVVPTTTQHGFTELSNFSNVGIVAYSKDLLVLQNATDSAGSFRIRGFEWSADARL